MAGRLRRSDPNGPGLRRRRCGRGFRYTDEHGGPVGPEDRERIRDLAIPPAWTEVWICPDPLGHLQAVGRDSAGRRQYLYHQRWRQRQDAAKFERVVEFARTALPRLRRQVEVDLRRRGLPRERVVAAAVRLLDLGTFRIGNTEYAEEHETFGLTTLLREHVQVGRDHARFTYVGKHGADLVEVVRDEQVCAVLRSLRRRRVPGTAEFFAWQDADGGWTPLRSEHVNDYVQQIAGSRVTAKDFRTWHATVLAAVALCGKPAGSEAARRTAVKDVCRTVSEALGNTASVVRASYLDPRLVDRFRGGIVLSDFCSVPDARALSAGSSGLRRVECAVIRMLDDR